MTTKQRIDQATVDKIYATADIVEVISDFVSLRKKGINFQAPCPFHNERTPSFVVSPAKGMFKCFGCGKGGNAVTFVMEHEGMNYVDALKYVAKKYNIEVEQRELSPDEQRQNDDKQSMMVVNSYAEEWFKKQLNTTDEGRSVGLGYFKHRGFSQATIDKFGLGYSPEKRDALTEDALRDGYKEEFLVGVGVTGKSERGLYDRFYNRVIFPIHSVIGRTVGFGGRTMRSDDRVAKYLNSPESEVYSKSYQLYGLFFAKKSITKEDSCILVEGYTDVISMHQAGVENVVATSGTALTEQQIKLIKRFTSNITAIFDGDRAGIQASLRGIDMILREGMNVRIVLLPDGEDPDSFARANDKQSLREYIANNEQDFISFKTQVLLADGDNDPIKRAELISDIIGSIAEIPDPIMRSLYTKQTAKSMDMGEQLLASEVARKRISHGSDSQTREFIKRQQRTQQAERQQQSNLVSSSIGMGSSIEELERELVKYLILYGGENFDYKEGDKIVELNVAEIIIGDIEENGLIFQNTSYRTIFEECSLFYKESSQNGGDGGGRNIEVGRFVNHRDPEVATTTVDILTDGENYQVSRMWEKFDVVVDSEIDRLSEAVPRAVILYKSKTITQIFKDLNEKLAKDELSESEQEELVRRLTRLNEETLSISIKLSRLII